MFRVLAHIHLVIAALCFFAFVLCVFNGDAYTSTVLGAGCIGCILSSLVWYGMQVIVDVLNSINKKLAKIDSHNCTALQYICDNIANK